MKICLYRIDGGATSNFKLEATLKNESKHTRNLKPDDVVVLDDVLRQLLDEHDIVATKKPMRWEPQLPEDQVQRDPRYARLPAAAYRGSPPPQEIKNAVSLNGCLDLGFAVVEAGFPHDQPSAGALGDHIHSHDHPSSPSSRVLPPNPPTADGLPEDSFPPSELLDRDEDDEELDALIASMQETEDDISLEDSTPRRRGPPVRGEAQLAYRSIAREVLAPRRRGLLSEVILDPCADPLEFIQSMLDIQDGDSIAVGALGAPDIDGRPMDAPAHLGALRGVSAWGTADIHVLYVGPSIVACVDDAVTRRMDEEYVDDDGVVHEQGWEPGPLASPEEAVVADPMAPYVRAVGAFLHDMLSEQRDLCERHGRSFVIVTADARPLKSRYRPLGYHDHRRDYQVRSIIGDAGRHACHLRFLVGERGPVVIKDDAEGRIGRRPLVA